MRTQKQLYSVTLFAANWVCIAGVIDELPSWLTIAASAFCFLDYLSALARSLPESKIQ